MNYQTTILIFFFSLLISCNESKSDKIVKRKDQPDVHILKNDSEMNTAIDNARKTIVDFEKAITSKNSNYYHFALKKRFKIGESGGEHIWISNIGYQNNKYYGIVDNLPNSTTGVQLGDTIEIPLEDITDWLYVDKNTVKGAYTTRVLRKRTTEQERKKMDSESGLIFEE
ncbi:DUF2314 domain-containing protein [Epilithonimonas tenax]|uniref:DUF2314 domain-containing protein n=1 Tax=Epilithonimonas tenax TaxID=191577 RepID=UPI0004013506|nr:DUF2314 domain-containing protein [Epilithonimonas tenax]